MDTDRFFITWLHRPWWTFEMPLNPKPTTNVGDVVAHFLSAAGIKTGFGIISVHNIPLLDAIARLGDLRFVMTRGETGAAHMADAHARVTGCLGLVISSTGPGAANTVTGLMEARFASSPVLHLTGQVPSHLIGRDTGSTHAVPDQLGMLRSVCKAAYRIRSADEALEVLVRAAREAMTDPKGPVSVEIPIDVQKQAATLPCGLDANVLHAIPGRPVPTSEALQELAQRVLRAARPMLWAGSGAKDAGPALLRLLDNGFAMVSSWAGRGIVPEDHPMSLGALNGSGVDEIQSFYATVDLMLVIGSRLRGQETVDQTIPLPANRIQIDIDPNAQGRTYDSSFFVCGDAALTLEALLPRIEGRMQVDPCYRDEFVALKAMARKSFAASLGPYADFAGQLRSVLPRDTLWVRDITIANSTWGNRLFELYGPRDGVYPIGAGIGQGLPLGIGAAVAAGSRKTVVLNGDAGFMMNVSELWTAVQEGLDLIVIIMNDAGYGVIRHMQDASFDGRRQYGDLMPPDFAHIARAARASYQKVTRAELFGEAVSRAIQVPGLSIVEVDMMAIGEAPPYFPYSRMSAKHTSTPK